jgi:hypothetical protein
LICERLLHYAAVLGPHRVIAGTDCGFASTAGSTAITADVAWLKLSSLVEGARLATEAYVNLNAPFRSPISLRPTGIRAVLITEHDAGHHKAAGRLPPAAVETLRASVWSFHHFELDTASKQQQRGGGGGGRGGSIVDGVFDELRWAIDLPVVFVAVGLQALDAAAELTWRLASDHAVARRPSVTFALGVAGVHLVVGTTPPSLSSRCL